MVERIINPRRGPRAPARCEARCLLHGGGFWGSDTIDVGPSGCQLVAPGPCQPGDPLELVLTNERLPDDLRVTAKVAWARGTAPRRIGVSFDPESLPASHAWFDRLVAAYPGLDAYQLAPGALDLDATVLPGPAPRVAPGLGREEAALLRAVGDGASVASLKARLGPEWPAFEGILFAMLARRLLTTDPGAAGPQAAWAPYLTGR